MPATKKLKEFVLNKCGHEKNPLSGSECIKQLVKNNHYVVATQDRDLQNWIRRQCGIALLYLHQIVPTLDDPSPVTKRFVEGKSKTGATVSEIDKEKLIYFKKKEGLQTETPKFSTKKKKSGPNPLSCKKKQKPMKSGDNLGKIKENPIEKKKRKRVKVAKHVKEILKSEIKS